MIIAHRGVHNNKNKIPENSLKAFSLAIEKGYGIEFDIEITKDDKLVIHHDDNLKRMTGVDKNTEDLTLTEIKELNLLDTNEKIPTFREFLDLVDGKVYLDIEIKGTRKVDKVCSLVLEELKDYKGELSLKSFSPWIVNCLRKKTNKYKIGLLVMEHSGSRWLNLAVKTKLIYKIAKFEFLAPHKKMLDKVYDKYIKDYPMYTWTVDGLKEAKEIEKKYLGVICICNYLD